MENYLDPNELKLELVQEEYVSQRDGHDRIRNTWRIGEYNVCELRRHDNPSSVCVWINKNIDAPFGVPEIYDAYDPIADTTIGFTIETAGLGALAPDKIEKLVAGYTYALAVVKMLEDSLLSPTADQPTSDHCDTAAQPPVQGNDNDDNPFSISDVPRTFVEVPFITDPDCLNKKCYVQLKSIEECLNDPDCKADVDDNRVYGISKGFYEELAAAPVKALYDGVRFYVASDKNFDFNNNRWAAWLLTPRFVKRVWVENLPTNEKPTETIYVKL